MLADQVMLKNGDTITGEIIKKDGDKLTVKSMYLGEVTMPWSAVTAVKSEQPVYVALPNGSTVNGVIVTQDSTLRVESSASPQTVLLANVSDIRNADEEKKHEKLDHPRLFDLWTGFFDLGFALTRGNSRTSTFNTAFDAVRQTRTDKATVYFTQVYSGSTVNNVSSTTAQAVRGGISYDHNVSPRVFLNVFNDYEYDRFQNLDLRFVVGGGAGYHVFKTEATKLDVLAGADYDRDSYSDNTRRSSAEGFGGDDLTYKVSGITALTQSARFFENLSDTGEYRLNFDLGTVTTLRKWLNWQVTASDRFLSNPPPGRQRNDLLLTTGLRVTFAR